MIGERILLVALTAIAGLIALAVVLLAAHGIGTLVTRLAVRGRIRQGRRALLDAARRGRADAQTAQAMRRLGREPALHLLEELAPSLAGPEREALTEVARDRGLIDHARGRSRSRRWRRRLHAVRVLSLLGGGEDVVPALLADPREEVRAQAAEWAADHPSEPVAARLVEMLEDPAQFARYTAMDSLVRAGAAATAPLARAIESGPGGSARVDALRVAAKIGDPRLAEPALTRAGDPDPAVRAWVARLLGGLGGERHAATVTGMLGDEAPEVRAAAALALGRLEHWPAAGALASCLRDSVWQVRRDAALALRALGAPGELLLERALREDDRFAADMARQTLDLPEAVLPA